MKIQLLSNEYWEKDDLLKKMDDDEFYYGKLGQEALSSSTIKLLYKSPKTYRNIMMYGQKSTKALTEGWLFHTAILEPHKFEQCVFVDASTTATNKYKDAKAEAGHDRVFLLKQKHAAERLADAFLRNERALEMIQDSEFEVPIVGMIEGFPFRGKADVLKNNGSIIDLKTSTGLKGFKYSADDYGYDIQVYIYSELFGRSYKDFKFLVIDKNSLDIMIATCSEEFYLRGKEKTLKGIQTYRKYFVDKTDIDNYTFEIEL